MLRLGKALTAVIESICLLAVLAPVAAAQDLSRSANSGRQTVWFAPSFSYGDHPGSVDNLALFKDAAPWIEAKKKVNVFQVPTHAILKMSDADLTQAIAKGKNKMPAYTGKLKDTEITALVAYVRQLGKGK